MKLPQPVRWLFYAAAGVLGLLALFLLFMAFVRIPIDLTGYKGIVETVVEKAIGRTVKVDGKVVVKTSLWPGFQIEGLRVGNPKGFRSVDFAQIQHASIRVGILPLLRRKIHIAEFNVTGLTVALEENKSGKVTWAFAAPTPSQQPISSPSRSAAPTIDKTESVPVEFASDDLVVKHLLLKDIQVYFQRAEMAEPYRLEINACEGAALAGENLVINMTGRMHTGAFTTDISAASLEELLETNRTWMKVKTRIAETTIALEGRVDIAKILDELQVITTISGKRLDSLNNLLLLDLPPVQSYQVTAQATLHEDRLDLSDFKIKVGHSRLEGSMTVDNTGSKPIADIKLKAPIIQLDDFVFKDWSPEDPKFLGRNQESSHDKRQQNAEADASKKDSTAADYMELFSPEVLTSADVSVQIAAEKILSGEDQLGSGQLVAALKDGHILVDPIDLSIPGGSFNLALSVKPGNETSSASVRVRAVNFDFGVLARRAKPDTDMGGILNLDVDLTSSANSLRNLLANGNGYIDFSGNPENLEAGVMDLWAVNIIAAVASKGSGKQSKINCLISRWQLRDGTLKPDVFVIDTSKIRICGHGRIDFNTQALELVMAPAPKKPEFFSLATPLALRGRFSDFELGVDSDELAGTIVTFISSPVHVPIRRLAGERLPRNGGDICGMGIGPENRPTKPPTGCVRLSKKVQ